MVISFFIISLACAVFLIAFGMQIINSKKELSSSIGSLCFIAALTIIFYVLGCMSTNINITYVFFGAYFVISDILAINAIKFYNEYITSVKFYKRIRPMLYLLTVGDGIIFTYNIWSHRIFTLYRNNINGFELFSIKYNSLFHIHFIYIYCLVGLSISVLLYKIIKSKGIYIRKYISMLLGLIGVISLELVVVFTNSSLDYSIVGYPILAVIIYHFNYHSIPNYIKTKLRNYIVDNMSDAVLGFDNNDSCIYYNGALKRFFNNRDINKVFKEYVDLYNLKDFNEYTFELSKGKGKNERAYVITYKKLLDNKDNYLGSSLFIHDRTENLRKTIEEKRKLSHDQLTNLYNREKFLYEVQILLNNSKEDYCMVATDIKNFRLINDIFGEAKGDEILIEISKILDKKYVNNSDIIYSRISRDNFAICIPKKKFNALSLSKALNKVGNLLDNKFDLYAYIGIYEITDKTIPVLTMYDNATIAIKYNKNSYTNLIAYYDEKITKNIFEEQKIINAFSNGLLNNDFKIFLQPQVNRDGVCVGAEALVRWIDASGKMMSPSMFIPVLEKNNLIAILDDKVWEMACEVLNNWKDNDKYISINISPYDFYYVDVYKRINELVKKYNIDKKRLRIEVTEAAFMDNKDSRIDILEKLKEDGFIVEMDDFGSGYSSLNLLKNINFDIIKMDMGFLDDTNNQDKSKNIISTIIELCKRLDMKVISEGIEKKEQVEFLSEFGCDYFQGYYFDKPIPVDQFEEKYLNRK